MKRDQVLGTVVIVNNPFPCGLCQPVPAALGCAQEGEASGLLRRRFLAPHNNTAGNTTTCLMTWSSFLTLLCLSFLISELGFVLRSASGNQVNGD